MNWKQMTIGKKINGGFGVVLSLLIAVVVLSYTIVGDVGDVVKAVSWMVNWPKKKSIT